MPLPQLVMSASFMVKFIALSAGSYMRTAYWVVSALPFML